MHIKNSNKNNLKGAPLTKVQSVEMRDSAREVLRHLVLEVGLPVTGDPETLAICQQGRAEVRSLKQLARRAVWRLPRMA